MPIIHSYSDREQKKLNIKIYSSILVVVGVIILTFSISATVLKNSQNNSNQEVKENNKYFCIDKTINNSDYEKVVQERINEKLILELSKEGNDCEAEIVRNPKDINPYQYISSKTFIAVTNIQNNIENIDADKLSASLNAQKYGDYNLVWNKETDEFLRTKYDFGVGQTVYSDSEILKKSALQRNYIAIIPFDQLNPLMKVLSLNGDNLLKDTVNLISYPLSDTYWFKSSKEYIEAIKKIGTTVFTKTNFDNTKLSSVLLTGTSAIGSDKYNINILNGKTSDYMANAIKTVVSSNDIFHISNEVSIYKSCFQKISSTFLCSLEKDFSVIKKLGVDIVNVSGNHIMDFGYTTFTDTLKWYKDNGLAYSGGGLSEELSKKPTVITKNGVKFGFLGFNFMPPYSYYARGENAGSTNISYKILRDSIDDAKKHSDIVIVDMNWSEELQTRIDQSQREYAQKAIEYGADIVNGVSSYSILGSDLTNNYTIFYGLGGFLHPQAKDGIMVRHTFYDKKYISIEIVPIKYEKDGTILIPTENYKESVLQSFFAKSSISLKNK